MYRLLLSMHQERQSEIAEEELEDDQYNDEVWDDEDEYEREYCD
jgi:hypothetical protein